MKSSSCRVPIHGLFKNEALLFRSGILYGEAIDASGLNLPGGGTNDGEFWRERERERGRETFFLEKRKKKVEVKNIILMI